MLSLLQKLAKTLGPRDTQVHEESILDPQETDYDVARIVVQSHDAKRAKHHYDYRLILPNSNRAISFASRKGLPQFTGEPKLFVQTPDHTIESATFSGNILPGYGEGPVKVIEDTKGIYKSIGNKLDLTIPKGNLKGRYTLIKQKGKNWLAIKHKIPTHHWEEYRSMSTADESLLDHPDFYAEKKYDGVHVIARLDSGKGITLAARNKSVMGEIIPKENHVPHIRDTKIFNEGNGIIFRGELVHELHPFSQTSSTLLSNPLSAVEAQKKIGKLVLIPHEIIRGPKGVPMQNYSQEAKLNLLSNIVNSINNPYIRMPEIEVNDKRNFYSKILREGGEGIVLKHKQTGESFKLKKSKDYDLKIVGIEPGAGKYLGRGAGAFKLADRRGRLVGRVGTGLSDQTRQDAFKNPKSYLHKIVRVGSLEVTPDGSLRNPRFLGYSEKPIADLVYFEKQASSQDYEEFEYQIQKEALVIPSPFPGMTVYSVDGQAVRDLADPNFGDSGNSIRHNFIPNGEIWLDNSLHPYEIPAVVLNEAIGSVQMNRGDSYEATHAVEKRAESKVRNSTLPSTSSDISNSTHSRKYVDSINKNRIK